MKRKLFVAVSRMVVALALAAVALAPHKANAIECTSAYYGDTYCTQCWVYSPDGWIPIGDTTWVTSTIIY